MTKKELIEIFDEMKKENESKSVIAFNDGEDKGAFYYIGFAWGMELAKKMLERSILK